jgi:predicted phage baseplate assembly protein
MRVNNVRWHEEDNLFTLSAADRSFITQTDNEQNTTVISGDGERGARLPTGIENITATHRSGIGKPGNVSAGQISMLVTRPLGVMGVSNPLRASGGAGPESLIMARHNVPLVTRALDRLVSLQDYEDFTRIFAGIGKTRAQMITDGRRRFVHLTIAGAEDIPIDKSSDLFHNLRLALAQNGDPYQPFQVDLRELVAIVISARVRLHADYQWEPVALEIRAALHDALGFDQRELGQDVLLSEVISVIQGVTGVVYVDVDILDGISETTATNPALLAQKLAALTTGAGPVKQPRERLPAELARLDSNGLILPAQLAFLNPETPDTLILTEIS